MADSAVIDILPALFVSKEMLSASCDKSKVFSLRLASRTRLAWYQQQLTKAMAQQKKMTTPSVERGYLEPFGQSDPK
jgi:hypothetical protein